MDASSTPNRPPPSVPPEYRQEIVHIPQALPPFWQRQSSWVLGGVGSLSVLAISTALFVGNRQAVYEPQPSQTLDKDAIVAGAAGDFDESLFNNSEQLAAFREQVLTQEADRYLREAQNLAQDPDADCYLQSDACGLNQFSLDAVTLLEEAKAGHDYQTMILAEARIQAIEKAREGVRPLEPEVNLTQLAIENLVQTHRRIEGASAEAKAAEVREP